MLWAQLTAALFMTVPKKLCPLADGSLAEAARGGGGGEEDIASGGGQFQRTSDLKLAAVWWRTSTHSFLYVGSAHTAQCAARVTRRNNFIKLALVGSSAATSRAEAEAGGTLPAPTRCGHRRNAVRRLRYIFTRPPVAAS